MYSMWVFSPGPMLHDILHVLLRTCTRGQGSAEGDATALSSQSNRLDAALAGLAGLIESSAVAGP
jgi:hypothetical protein